MQTLPNLYLFNSFQQSYEQVIDITVFNLGMTPIICTTSENLQVQFEKFFTNFFSIFTCLFQKMCYMRERPAFLSPAIYFRISLFSSLRIYFFVLFFFGNSIQKFAHTRMKISLPGLKISGICDILPR